MKTRKNTAIILSAMLVCGALTACGGSESEPFVNPKDAIVTTIGTTPSLTEAEAPAEQVESLTAADADAEPKEDQLSDGAAFAPATGILTLSGKVTREDLEPYADNEAVEAIYAAEGTVFPEDCTNLFLDLEAKTIDISQADTSAVTNMKSMFERCQEAAEIKLGNIDTSHVTTMESMFNNCTHLESLDLSGLDSGSVETLSNMFSNCWSLESIDLTGFNCPGAKYAKYMFSNCGALKTLDVSGMEMTKLMTMEGMFEDCASLKELDLSAWNTPSLGSMFGAFEYCRSLEKLDLSGISTANNTMLMNNIFRGCGELTTIIVSDKWVLAGDARLSDSPFKDCVKLVGGNGTAYDDSKDSPEYMRIDTPDAPGLFTAAG